MLNVVSSELSQYQHIMIMEDQNGVSLALDGHFQTNMPNNEYYEILLSCNPGSYSVAVLGGGDLTGVPVLCSHLGDRADWNIYEIDSEVVKLCAQYCPVPKSTWGPCVTFCDALEKLAAGEIRADHIIVDLLGIHRVNELSSALTVSAFVAALAKNAQYAISGFVGGGTQGMLTSEFLRRELYKHKFCYYSTIISSMDEVMFVAGKSPLNIPHKFSGNVVRYRPMPKTADVLDVMFEDKMVIIKEAF